MFSLAVKRLKRCLNGAKIAKLGGSKNNKSLLNSATCKQILNLLFN